MLYFYHTPKLGPARAMLIERLCYYRGRYYRGSTVYAYDQFCGNEGRCTLRGGHVPFCLYDMHGIDA